MKQTEWMNVVKCVQYCLLHKWLIEPCVCVCVRVRACVRAWVRVYIIYIYIYIYIYTSVHTCVLSCGYPLRNSRLLHIPELVTFWNLLTSSIVPGVPGISNLDRTSPDDSLLHRLQVKLLIIIMRSDIAPPSCLSQVTHDHIGTIALRQLMPCHVWP